MPPLLQEGAGEDPGGGGGLVDVVVFLYLCGAVVGRTPGVFVGKMSAFVGQTRGNGDCVGDGVKRVSPMPV